jgi:hypothetical protein
VIHPPILPSCLDFLFPPMRPGITSFLSVIMSSSCPPSLTMSSTSIVVRVSHSHNKCTSCHLTSSLLPCLIAFKNRRSSKMILRIVAPLCCQRWRCCHPKARSVCQPHGSLIFHGLLPMQSRVLIAYGRMANSIFLRGSQRKRVWILAYCQTIPPPPPKEECLQCASVTLLRPAGRWRGDTEGEQGQNGDEVHGADAVFDVGFGRKY